MKEMQLMAHGSRLVAHGSWLMAQGLLLMTSLYNKILVEEIIPSAEG